MRNLTLLTDLYQITMMNGYFNENTHQDIVVFDMFFRKNPCKGAYTIVCGIDQLVDYIKNIKFNDDDISYLKSLNLFSLDFLNYLKDFSFTGDIYAVQEGTIMFPNEPIVRVKAPLCEAQFIETTLLNIINFQSLIATKASRVCLAAQGDYVMEFGLRRAQGPDAGIYGSRAAIIGGCHSSANVLAGQMFDIPIVGTHAHSWVQKFDTELDSFRAYANSYPDNTLLLVDTYDVLNSGVPNAITVFNELKEKGHTPVGIRIDSGDLEYLSKKSRKMLDDAGFENTSIVVSNDLDEYKILDLKGFDAKINSWGVGTKLITSSDCPALGGVYKLSGVFKQDKFVPKIKISEQPEKINNPGFKKVVRIYNKSNNKAEADLIMLNDEIINSNEPLTVFHPTYTWKSKTFKNYYIKELLQPLFINGKSVHEKKSVMKIRDFVKTELSTLWAQYKRINSPEIYKVDLSNKLWKLKCDMINEKK